MAFSKKLDAIKNLIIFQLLVNFAKFFSIDVKIPFNAMNFLADVKLNIDINFI